MRTRSIPIILFIAQILTFGTILAEKRVARPKPGSGSSVEQRARNVIEEIERGKFWANGKTSGFLYLIDFDNTIHNQDGPYKMESIVNEDVLMKSLLDRANGIEDEYSEKIRDFLVDQAVKLGNYKIDDFTTVQELFGNSKNFRKDISKSVGEYFTRKVAPNHRISYLLEFGCSRDQIESNYTNISRDYRRYYTGIRQNRIMVEIICQLLHAKKKVFILTDNSEANVLVGSRHMKLEETIRERLAELGTTLDPKIPIIAGETDINGILPVDLSTRPLIPIISLFKRRPKISEHFFEISTKKCYDSRKTVERELREKYGIDTKNIAFVMFDDDSSTLTNLKQQDIMPVFVQESGVTIGGVVYAY